MHHLETLYQSVGNFSTPSSPSMFDSLAKVAQVDLDLDGFTVDPLSLPTLTTPHIGYFESSFTLTPPEIYTPPYLYEHRPLDSFEELLDENNGMNDGPFLPDLYIYDDVAGQFCMHNESVTSQDLNSAGMTYKVFQYFADAPKQHFQSASNTISEPLHPSVSWYEGTIIHNEVIEGHRLLAETGLNDANEGYILAYPAPTYYDDCYSVCAPMTPYRKRVDRMTRRERKKLANAVKDINEAQKATITKKRKTARKQKSEWV
ncbi:hypothetical protein M422DRAFT_775829 [Sphaerobolus stellatus SS14]|nr:hypothetical protein M422DRAFT_775829 [Sphaerobolus stellatus SS14]